jgi:hypothetical protein
LRECPIETECAAIGIPCAGVVKGKVVDAADRVGSRDIPGTGVIDRVPAFAVPCTKSPPAVTFKVPLLLSTPGVAA